MENTNTRITDLQITAAFVGGHISNSFQERPKLFKNVGQFAVQKFTITHHPVFPALLSPSQHSF